MILTRIIPGIMKIINFRLTDKTYILDFPNDNTVSDIYFLLEIGARYGLVVGGVDTHLACCAYE